MKTPPLINLRDLGTPVQVLLRLLLGAAVLLPLAVVYGETLVSTWLAAYRVVFSWVADDFKLLNLYIDQEGADRVLRAWVVWQHVVVIGGQVIYPDPRGTANASTLLAHALQGPLVAVLAAIAWPTQAKPAAGKPPSLWLEWAARAVVLPPLLAVPVLMDMPMVLAGELWDLTLEALHPGATSALVIWTQFIQDGGRYALGLVVGVLATLLARRLSLTNNAITDTSPISRLTNLTADLNGNPCRGCNPQLAANDGDAPLPLWALGLLGAALMGAVGRAGRRGRPDA